MTNDVFLTASWRVYKFPLSNRSPAVTRLHVHTEDNQTVLYEDEQELMDQIESKRPPTSTLIEFMKLCENDAVGMHGRRARELLYIEIPEYFTWTKKVWKPRGSDRGMVGRLHPVPLSEREAYFLRIMLSNLPGVYFQSWDHICTVRGIKYNSF